MEIWKIKRSYTNTLVGTGRLDQEELSSRIDSFIITATGETEHQHNQLLSAILSNLGRDPPETPVASWVSANDKPATAAGSKPVSGDAAEQRLKAEVKALPARDRKRLKALKENEVRLPFRLTISGKGVFSTFTLT